MAGVDVADAPQIERNVLLSEVLAEPPPRIALSTHVSGHASEALALTQRGRYEGVVLKRADAAYAPGRSQRWQKIKHVDTEDLAVVGYIRASTARTGAHALLLTKPGPDGWQYAGRVKGLGEADSKAAAQLIGQ